jgi:deoxyribodipyrimidine photo-lyase
VNAPAPSIVWLRRDLRTADNPALIEAAARGPVVPLFIWAAQEEAPWQPGAASRVWLHRSLESLMAELAALGAPLVLRRGPSLQTLLEVAREARATCVFWNRCYEPALVARDTDIKRRLDEQGLHAESFNAALLHEPPRISNKQGKPFRVFTPFYRHCVAQGTPAPPREAPPRLRAATAMVTSLPLSALGLRPALDWDSGILASWTPGSSGADAELDGFADAAVLDYGSERDRPDRSGVSRLSPHLHHGELSPRQVWHRIATTWHASAASRERAEPFLRQLYWREFAHHLLYHFPDTPQEPLQAKFTAFPWRKPGPELDAWQRGETGYPLVDAGMRELWHTGWMHNRVRMNVSSFLVKHLLIHWREGARWFWDTLVDADLANNTMGWQWCAGSGADAAPYFRIFNPTLQGERYDPDGQYVRRWIPELAGLPDRHIHKPWQAPAAMLSRAGVTVPEAGGGACPRARARPGRPRHARAQRSR